MSEAKEPELLKFLLESSFKVDMLYLSVLPHVSEAMLTNLVDKWSAPHFLLVFTI
jgi:hypothetical protein